MAQEARKPTQTAWQSARYLVALAIGALLGSGCASTAHDELVAFLRAHEAEVAGGSYTVRPPDSIAIHAPGAEEIDGTVQSVRSDGKVVLRLLGEVDVAGLSPEEIADKLETQLTRYYDDPEVLVQVAAYKSQFYYVFGEVNGAGPYPYTGRDTLLMALAQARPTFLAWRSQVRVTRPAPDGEEAKTIVVDLGHMVRSGDLSQNILLQEGDIVVVPPTPLAWVGLRVRELLFPVDPLLQAYGRPADAIRWTHTYEDEFGSSSDSGDGGRRRYRP